MTARNSTRSDFMKSVLETGTRQAKLIWIIGESVISSENGIVLMPVVSQGRGQSDDWDPS